MTEYNDTNVQENIEAEERCPGCPRHCPVTELSCGRGRAMFTDDGRMQTEYDRHEHGEHDHHEHGEHDHHEHGEHDRHEHGEHGRQGHGEHGRHGHGEHGRQGEQRCPFEKDDSLYGLMRRCGHYLYQRRGSQGQRRVLTILQERGSMQQRELQEYLGVQPGSMSELIGKLEQKGLLIRSSSDEDRRSRILTLTQSGQDMISREETTGELFETLTAQEQEQLKGLLEKLLAAWDNG